MSVTSGLFKAARLSATMRAASRGPGPLARRAVRIGFGRLVIGRLWRGLERLLPR